MLALPGVPYIYYGEEIGLIGTTDNMDNLTPLQWSGETNAGFSTGTPWMTPNSKYKTFNIADQQVNYTSFWHIYRQFIRIRQDQSALRKGNYFTIDSDDGTYTFLRQDGDEAIIVASNLKAFTASDVSISLSYGTLTPGNYTLIDLLTGVSHNVTVTAEGGFMNENIGDLGRYQVALYKLFPLLAETSVDVVFNVDMSKMIRDDDFDPATQSVDMVSDLNCWGGTLTAMEDLDGDSVYTVTISDLPIGSTVEFKYRIDAVNNGKEEYAYSDFVREYLVQDVNNEIKNPYAKNELTSIENNSLGKVRIYPVPVKDQLVIELTEMLGDVEMTISELTGKLIMKETLSNQVSTINVSNLVEGMYMLKLSSENGSMSRKIIKEN